MHADPARNPELCTLHLYSSPAQSPPLMQGGEGFPVLGLIASP